MTKEKAITIIESHKAHWQRLLRAEICDETEGRETIEGFDMAISALSAEPYLEVDDYENQIADLHNRLDIAEYDKERYKEEITILEAENKGEWIYQEGVTPYKWRCNKCEKMFKTDFNYCPNCGADMRGKSCRCNTCKNNDDELSGECYECLKGMYDHYEKENKTEVENGRTND